MAQVPPPPWIQALQQRDPEFVASYVSQRERILFIGESVSLQPVVEGGDSGIERLQVMLPCDVFWRADLIGAASHRSQGAFEASKRRSLGLSAGGLSSAVMKRR